MPRVLSTKLLSKSQQNLILNQGWSFVQYSAIQLSATYPKHFFEDFSTKNVIITSPFAARILLKERPSIENLFVVGEKTSKLLSRYYIIKEVANYGEELAKIIAKNHASEKFTFLCGNLRKEHIPILLKYSKVSLDEQQIYKTSYNLQRLAGHFDAVIFCSPSAVESYFGANQPEQETTYICIGASTLKQALVFTKRVKIASKISVESCIVALKDI